MIDVDTATMYIRCGNCGMNGFTCDCTFPPSARRLVRKLTGITGITPRRETKKMLSYEYNGTTYVIEFTREKRRVTLPNPIDRKIKHSCQSTYPFTTVTISTVSPEGVLRSYPTFATATVGCHHRDKYVVDLGRKAALKRVMPLVPKGMRPVIWETYLNRGKKSVDTVENMSNIETQE